MVFDCIDYMEGIVFGKILDTIVIDIKRKGGLLGGVAPEDGGVFHGLIAIRG